MVSLLLAFEKPFIYRYLLDDSPPDGVSVILPSTTSSNTDGTQDEVSTTVEETTNSATRATENTSGTVEDASATVVDVPGTVVDVPGTIEDVPGTVETAAPGTVETGTVENAPGTVENAPTTVENTPGTVDDSVEISENEQALMEDTLENGQRQMEDTLGTIEDGPGTDRVLGSVSIVDECLFGTQSNNQVGTSTFIEQSGGSLIQFGSSCDDLSLSSTDQLSDASSSEYCPTPMKRQWLSTVDLGNSLFVYQTTQLQSFIDSINGTSLCYTPDCTGKLVPVGMKHVGLGGSVVIQFSCTMCSEHMLNLTSSVDIEFSKRSVCSLALQVAFVAGGCAHAQYSKILKQYLGLSAVNPATFYDTVKLLQPVVDAMLVDMCNESKAEMKAQDPTVVGSWKRAITSSDGVWLTRGRFSQNCSFTVRNYMNNSLLYFIHLSMQGKSGGELYHGTAKGAEGHAASIVFWQSQR